MSTGADYIAKFQAVFDPKVEGQPEIEKIIIAAFKAGDVPDYLAVDRWKSVTVSAVIETKVRKLTYRVSPWLEIGASSPLLVNAQPPTLQTIADAFKAYLPSKKIVLDVFRQADVKIPLQVPGKPMIIPGAVFPRDSTISPPAPDMTTPQAFSVHNAMVRTQLAGRSPGDHIVAGHSKAVVIGPNLPATKLAIYGGWAGNSTPAPQFVDGFFYQGYPGPHGVAWVDYSQCSFLVARAALLDGVNVDLVDIFQHPVLSQLVSDQGPFMPRFPNAGSGGSILDTSPGSGGGNQAAVASVSSANPPSIMGPVLSIGIPSLALYGIQRGFRAWRARREKIDRERMKPPPPPTPDPEKPPEK